MTGVRVEGHDHVVVPVADVERSLTWYRDLLGLEVEREAEWRAGEAPFPSIRIDNGAVIDLLAGERTGQNIDHVALRVADDTDLDAVASSGDFDVVRGPIWVGARRVTAGRCTCVIPTATWSNSSGTAVSRRSGDPGRRVGARGVIRYRFGLSGR